MLSNFTLQKTSGFSLIELMIGIVIFAITMTYGVSSYRVWVQNTQIRNAAESIQNGLQRARSEAVKTNQNVFFMLGANSSWIVSPGIPPVALPANCTNAALLDCRLNSEGSRNVSILGFDAAGAAATTITFDNLGLVGLTPNQLNANGSQLLRQIQVDSTVLSAANSRDLVVRIGTNTAGVWAGSAIKMCDSNLAVGKPGACS